jgi:A/G-specific adenine glycosylase
MDSRRIAIFQEKVWDFYHEYGRHDLPWRVDPSPYHVFISEIMLQQTQVSRVLVKYAEWLAAFPDFAAVARAGVGEVLGVWQGLGYNRRGLWLREAAMRVMDEYGGVLPRETDVLVKLRGVGVNTAGSMVAFAYNEPVVFIETNIRRVFIYEFFAGDRRIADISGRRTSTFSFVEPVTVPAPAGELSTSTPIDTDPIADAQLRPLVEATLDQEHPREWYWALMDYGSDLAKRVPNPNRRSKHYARQSQFEGSLRQVRGEVLRQLLAGPKSASEMDITDNRLAEVLSRLQAEGFIMENRGVYQVCSPEESGENNR